MTREEARKAAEVMLAYANGKQVEISLSDKAWREVNNPTFNWKHNDYRIKLKDKWLFHFYSCCWHL